MREQIQLEGGDSSATAARREAAATVAEAVASRQGSLDELQAKALIDAYGIPVPESGVAHSEDEAVAIARRIGAPVAVKSLGPHIRHKPEHGLIAMGLSGDQAVRAAARSLLARAGAEDSRLLVERMVQGTRELMVGMKRDPLYGPVVVFGVGGIFTEAYRDVSFGVTPLDDRDIEGMLTGIRATALLDGFRGMPPVDRAALAGAILAVAAIAENHPAVSEIDVNPLIVEDVRPVAADALVISTGRSLTTHRYLAETRRRRSTWIRCSRRAPSR